MTALAHPTIDRHGNVDGALGGFLAQGSLGTSREAESVLRYAKQAQYHSLKAVNVHNHSVRMVRFHVGVNAQLLRAVFNQDCYYLGLGYLARKTGVSPSVLMRYLEDNKNTYRKSTLQTSDGQPVYMLNTPFSYLKDLWGVFCYLNSQRTR